MKNSTAKFELTFFSDWTDEEYEKVFEYHFD